MTTAVEVFITKRDIQAEYRVWEGWYDYISKEITKVNGVSTRVAPPSKGGPFPVSDGRVGPGQDRSHRGRGRRTAAQRRTQHRFARRGRRPLIPAASRSDEAAGTQDGRRASAFHLPQRSVQPLTSRRSARRPSTFPDVGTSRSPSRKVSQRISCSSKQTETTYAAPTSARSFGACSKGRSTATRCGSRVHFRSKEQISATSSKAASMETRWAESSISASIPTAPGKRAATLEGCKEAGTVPSARPEKSFVCRPLSNGTPWTVPFLHSPLGAGQELQSNPARPRAKCHGDVHLLTVANDGQLDRIATRLE